MKKMFKKNDLARRIMMLHSNIDDLMYHMQECLRLWEKKAC